MSTLLILFGISGSGKTTWRKQYIQEHHNPSSVEYVCPDEIRKELTGSVSDQTQNGKVWQITKERTINLLRTKEEVILDATNLKEKDRNNFLKDLPKGTRIVFKIFEISPEVSKERIKKDLENNVDRSNVPDYVIDNMYKTFLENVDKIRKNFSIL